MGEAGCWGARCVPPQPLPPRGCGGLSAPSWAMPQLGEELPWGYCFGFWDPWINLDKAFIAWPWFQDGSNHRMSQAFTGTRKQPREDREKKEVNPHLLHPRPIPDESSNDGHTHGLRAVRAQHANFSHHCHALDVKRQEKKLQDIIMLTLRSPGTQWGKSCCPSNTKRVEEGKNMLRAWLFKEPWP